MDLRDITGPYIGQVRTYLKHAGENALASGFAELPEKNAPQEVAIAPPVVEAVAPSELVEDIYPRQALNGDFPGLVDLQAAGIYALGDVPTDVSALTAIPGIGRATAKRILGALKG